VAGEPRARARRSTSRIGLPLRGVANAPISMRWHTQHRPWNSRRRCGDTTRFHLHPARSGARSFPRRVADLERSASGRPHGRITRYSENTRGWSLLTVPIRQRIPPEIRRSHPEPTRASMRRAWRLRSRRASRSSTQTYLSGAVVANQEAHCVESLGWVN